MKGRSRRRALRVAGVLGGLPALLLGALACGSSRAPAPGPGSVQGFVPDLRGVRVMVLPVQDRGDGPHREVERELVFALQDRGEGIDWVRPDEIREILDRSPGVQVPLEALPVGSFLASEVRRVGDPLYGHLRRLGGLTGSEVALLPLRVRYGDGGPEAGGREAGAEGRAEGSRALEIWATLVNVRDGRVYWFAVLEGEPGPPGAPEVAATVADALAGAVAW